MHAMIATEEAFMLNQAEIHLCRSFLCLLLSRNLLLPKHNCCICVCLSQDGDKLAQSISGASSAACPMHCWLAKDV